MPGVIRLNPDCILYDTSGNPIGVLDDSGIYRLQVEAKIEGVESDLSNTLPIIPIEHHKIHGGKSFFIEDWLDISGQGTNLDILLVTGTNSPHFVWLFSSEASFVSSFYEDCTASGGSSLSIFNHNRNSSNTPTLSVYTGSTITDVGNLLLRQLISSGHKEGSAREWNHEIILKPNSKYLLRVSKVDSGTDAITYHLDWYEG